MKKITILFALVAFLAAPAVKAQSERNVSGFNSIKITGPMNVNITQGDNESVRVEADQEDMERIITEVNGNVLMISAKELKGNKDVTIHVTAKEITSVDLTGSGNVTGRNLIKGQSLRLMIAGSGNMSMDVGVNDLIVGLTGSGNLTLTGQTQDLKMRVSGSGNADALKLHAQKADVHVSGSGNAMVNVKGDLTGSLSGSGDIEFMGTPKINNINVRGSGKLKPVN